MASASAPLTAASHFDRSCCPQCNVDADVAHASPPLHSFWASLMLVEGDAYRPIAADDVVAVFLQDQMELRVASTSFTISLLYTDILVLWCNAAAEEIEIHIDVDDDADDHPRGEEVGTSYPTARRMYVLQPRKSGMAEAMHHLLLRRLSRSGMLASQLVRDVEMCTPWSSRADQGSLVSAAGLRSIGFYEIPIGAHQQQQRRRAHLAFLHPSTVMNHNTANLSSERIADVVGASQRRPSGGSGGINILRVSSDGAALPSPLHHYGVGDVSPSPVAHGRAPSNWQCQPTELLATPHRSTHMAAAPQPYHPPHYTRGGDEMIRTTHTSFVRLTSPAPAPRGEAYCVQCHQSVEQLRLEQCRLQQSISQLVDGPRASAAAPSMELAMEHRRDGSWPLSINYGPSSRA